MICNPWGLTLNIVADHLGIDIKVINRFVNGKTSVSSELALKLTSTFDTSPEFWLLLILFIPKAYSVECQWFQNKVATSDLGINHSYGN